MWGRAKRQGPVKKVLKNNKKVSSPGLNIIQVSPGEEEEDRVLKQIKALKYLFKSNETYYGYIQLTNNGSEDRHKGDIWIKCQFQNIPNLEVGENPSFK